MFSSESKTYSHRINKIDVLEGRLLDKEEENKKLLTQIDSLNKHIDQHNDEY